MKVEQILTNELLRTSNLGRNPDKRKVFTFIGGHHMKIRNVAFIAALIGWIALAVYYVTPSESAVAKEIETAPKTVGETLVQSLKV